MLECIDHSVASCRITPAAQWPSATTHAAQCEPLVGYKELLVLVGLCKAPCEFPFLPDYEDSGL